MTDLGPSSLRVVAVAPYVIAEQPPPHRLRQQLAAVPKRSMPLARRLATRRFDILVRSGPEPRQRRNGPTLSQPHETRSAHSALRSHARHRDKACDMLLDNFWAQRARTA